MRRLAVCLASGILLCVGLVVAQGGGAPAKARATTAEIPFEIVPNFFKLPAGLYMSVANSFRRFARAWSSQLRSDSSFQSSGPVGWSVSQSIWIRTNPAPSSRLFSPR